MTEAQIESAACNIVADIDDCARRGVSTGANLAVGVDGILALVRLAVTEQLGKASIAS